MGKTALVQCFHANSYPKNYVMTSWVDFCVKQVGLYPVSSFWLVYVLLWPSTLSSGAPRTFQRLKTVEGAHPGHERGG